MKLKLQFIMAAFFVLAIYIPAAHAQARLTFSGGSNTPLSTTLQTAVTYTITNTSCATSGPLFVFQRTGNPFANSGPSTISTITFRINNGASQPITVESSGASAGNVTANDIYVYGTQPGVANGATVVLSAGTLTTSTNIAATKPADGIYTTFLINNSGVRCSSDGVSAPTAASVSIGGRVMTESRRGIRNVLVRLVDEAGETRTVLTSTFGYYRFADVPAGQTYTISASAKRYSFAQPTQALSLLGETDDVNFVANSEGTLIAF